MIYSIKANSERRKASATTQRSGSCAPVNGSAAAELVEREYPECPNCKERKTVCACLRNICIKCGKPVGNITFTVCDDCWDKPHTPELSDPAHRTGRLQPKRESRVR